MLYLSLMFLAGCGDPNKEDDTNDETDPACEPATEDGCADLQVCEEVDGGEPACFDPLYIGGSVFALSDGAPIGEARVVVMDVNGAPVSEVAISDPDGAYRVMVPTTRQEDGTPVSYAVTLRADAAGFMPFPSSFRPALPVDTSGAAAVTGAWLVANSSTDIGLIEVPLGTGTGIIAGTCEIPEIGGGALVTAGRASGIADRDGSFAIFNLDPGSYTVNAWRAGFDYTPASASVSADLTTTVSLSLAGEASGEVNGSVQIVNAPGGSVTSVILVVESTFDEALARGELPPGLRAGGVSGSFSISGVPAGDWVVLAAFENDDLVRDPDPSIGGTQIQHVTVNGDTVSTEGFKVTEALAILSPAQGEQVNDSPTLSWVDDSSEDEYWIVVYDAFGRVIWETVVDRATGDDPSVAWGGPPLDVGMYYQLKVTSIKDGDPISTSEDLSGVFYR